MNIRKCGLVFHLYKWGGLFFWTKESDKIVDKFRWRIIKKKIDVMEYQIKNMKNRIFAEFEEYGHIIIINLEE